MRRNYTIRAWNLKWNCRKPLLAVADPNAQGCDVHFTRGFGHYAVNDNTTRNAIHTRHGNAGHTSCRSLYMVDWAPTILSLAVSVLSIERAYRTPDPELIIFDYFLWFPLYSFATSKIKIYRTAGTLPEARYILLLRLYRIMHAVATIIRFVVRGLFLFYIFPSKSWINYREPNCGKRTHARHAW